MIFAYPSNYSELVIFLQQSSDVSLKRIKDN